MPYIVPIEVAQFTYPDYSFIKALSPSEQKAAFHVRDSEGNDLCFKIVSPDYDIQRLRREIQALQALHHPNVVGLKEYTFRSREAHVQHYLIEEFIPGSDLEQHLIEGKGWEIKKAIRFFSALLDGMDALRQAHLVHRDLKPRNIRVKPNGTPVIIDFGLARHLDKTDITRTAEGAALGTPLYFAPEQFRGTKHDIEHRTDLFAIGLIMYQALTGHHPFYRRGMNYDELLEATCNSNDYLDFSSFKGLPDRVRLIASKLLEKEKVRRPHTAGQVKTILEKLEGLI